ncbi:DNA-processing protein DprA [Parapusillimonas sp. JC17]|uniref:DNA-processing protein DprA n=1 Tax=Parapusillimonas sp. JC17 TaxID=3445768 RepID=UPI003FA0D3D7
MSSVSPATQTLLALSMLKGVGPAALKKVAALPNFEDIPIEALTKSIPAIEKALLEPDAWIIAQEAAAKQIDEALLHEARIISGVDQEYPSLLAATKDDPFILFVKGTLAQASERSVAIIGTREPTMHGQRIAASITKFFVEREWSIVSGLAIGCDAVAHQTALEEGGHTVAVLAHGLQMIAPTRHRKLADKILDAGGALISEYSFGQIVRGQQYVKRDRTQAGLAQGVVMIQSDIKGGSLYASRASLDYDRWLAVPYPTDKDRERGEAKIQANLVIADGDAEQRTELLRCSPSKLKKIIVLHSREQYLQLLGPVGQSAQESSSKPQLEQLSSGQPILTESGSKPSVTVEADEGFEEQLPRSVQDNEAPVPIAKVNTSLRESVSRRVVFSKGWLAGLKIQQIPAEGSQDFKNLPKKLRNGGLLAALSARLRYLQMQLDLLVELSSNARGIADDEHRLVIQFVVEVMVAHMQRAVGALTELAGDEHIYERDLFTAENNGRQETPQQFELGYARIPEQESDFLLGTLDEFLGTLLQPLRFAEGCAGAHGVLGDVELRFDDLVTTFNALIAKGLNV